MGPNLFFLCGVLFTSLAQASPYFDRRNDYVVHEKRVEQPAWTRIRRLEGHIALPLRIGLKQRNLDRLPDYLMAVADPASPSYGQHWTQEQIVEAFSPSQDSHDVVHEWLVNAGFDAKRLRRSFNKAWVDIRDATADEVERLLDTQYHVYEHEEGAEHIGCESYSLPRSIADVVDIVTPTVQPDVELSRTQNLEATTGLSRRSPYLPRAVVGSNLTLADCDQTFTLDCLRTLYNISHVPKATDRNSLGIVSYYSNTYLQSDLDMFFRNFSPSLVGKSPSLVSINEGSIEIDESSSVEEDDWILEYAMSLVEPQSVMLLQVGGKNEQADGFPSFNQWLDAVDASYCTSDGGDDFTYDPHIPNPFPGGLKEHSCGIIKSPNVVSNSQADHEYRFSQFYLNRQCNEFAKLGLMGVTVLYAAGNSGVSGAQSGSCLDKNGSMNLNATNFNPAWPASCPWVTTVGGTQVKPNITTAPSSGAEEVWNQEILPGFFTSGGGGFSNRFPTPSYQEQAVQTFLQGLKKTDPALLKNFNFKGRGYPDLSANANMFVTIANGDISISSGTSGATPTIASIITLVNDARLAAGKKPVGFINPTIYSANFASAFNDITSGTSQGCKGLQGVRDGGFKAVKGWDPASGLGSPNSGILIEKWLALP